MVTVGEQIKKDVDFVNGLSKEGRENMIAWYKLEIFRLKSTIQEIEGAD